MRVNYGFHTHVHIGTNTNTNTNTCMIQNIFFTSLAFGISLTAVKVKEELEGMMIRIRVVE